ncbi:MAG: hypothetical protein Q7R96_03770 [Nanoarchaeota archaeon]|nr:hypothetical protein [Nanoarchaeota archaeon]
MNNKQKKKVHILGDGQTGLAPRLGVLCQQQSDKLEVVVHEREFGPLIEKLVKDYATKMVFFPAEFGGAFPEAREQLLGSIRKDRKDIFAVAFKSTDGYSPEQQYVAGLNVVKAQSLNLVVAHDNRSLLNMIVAPEETYYHQTKNLDEVLRNVVEMAYLRSHLTFTRSTVVAGDPVSWNDPLVPASLRAVVDYCVQQGAYKTFRGATVGHFAVKVDDHTFLTSRRKTNFNELNAIGLVKVVTDGPDHILAYGSKPSVGGQSQRIVFQTVPKDDCIVHFHCPKKPGVDIPSVSQREYECGSHECGQNTARGLKKYGNLHVVYLDNHGPNIVFHQSIDPKEVTDFIDQHFDLSKKTGGYVALP